MMSNLVSLHIKLDKYSHKNVISQLTNGGRLCRKRTRNLLKFAELFLRHIGPEAAFGFEPDYFSKDKGDLVSYRIKATKGDYPEVEDYLSGNGNNMNTILSTNLLLTVIENIEDNMVMFDMLIKKEREGSRKKSQVTVEDKSPVPKIEASEIVQAEEHQDSKPPLMDVAYLEEEAKRVEAPESQDRGDRDEAESLLDDLAADILDQF